MVQNLKITAYSMQNVLELDMKKISHPKALTSGVWDLQTALGQLGQPWLQFSQTRPHFLKNHEMNPIKL